MFRQINSFEHRFPQNFNNMQDAQFPGPGIGYPVTSYPMYPQFCTYRNEFQDEQFDYYIVPEQCPEIPTSIPYPSNFPEDGKTEILLQENKSVEESEAVDELLEILVECVDKSDLRTKEVLLRKFFCEIEKEIPLERFIVERIKNSRTKLLSESLEKIYPCSRDIYSGEKGDENDVLRTREVDVNSVEKLERFKVKTVQVGDVVKVEAK